MRYIIQSKEQQANNCRKYRFYLGIICPIDETCYEYVTEGSKAFKFKLRFRLLKKLR